MMMDGYDKGFDTVSRSGVMEDLESILDRDELHLIKIRIEDVKLCIKINGKISNPFATNSAPLRVIA